MPTQYGLTRDAQNTFPDSYPQILVSKQGIPVTYDAPKLAFGRGLRPAGGRISHPMPTQYGLTRDAQKAFPDSYPQILVSKSRYSNSHGAGPPNHLDDKMDSDQ